MTLVVDTFSSRPVSESVCSKFFNEHECIKFNNGHLTV